MRHPYADFIHKVAKPARYLGGEYNSRPADPDAFVSMALAFPDAYELGMSHLGTKILYSLLNDHPRITAERCFAPWPDLEQELRQRELPLVSLESARALRDFDVVGFSLQYELTFTTVLLMLELGGIPLRSADRGEDDPLVIAGGPTATHAEPMAPFLDAILVGDGEERLPEMLLLWKERREAGDDRRAALTHLAGLGGVYVPALYRTTIDERSGFEVVDGGVADGVSDRVERAFVEDINRYPFPDASPVPAAEAVFDRMGVEIARGCTEGCRFCQAGMIYRPVRERSPKSIVDSVLGAVEKGGYDEVSLTALSTADVSCIAPLVHEVSEELTKRKVSMSVSSLRAYGLPGEVLDDISRVRAAGLTFAPEAGTQRMRDVICKNITEEDMTGLAHRVFSRGWSKAKLYFMIGLPTEEDDDVRGIMETGRKVRDVALEYHKKGRVDVAVSVSSHVPKPHTPFQWCAMDSLEEIERKQALLSDMAQRPRMKLKLHEPLGSWLECILGRGDRRVADVIEAAYRGGCRFDGWDEHLKWDVWQEAFRQTGLDPTIYLGTIPTDARLPWDHIDVGLDDGFLAKEYRKSLAGRLSPPCGKPVHAKVHHTNIADAEADTKRLVCYDCGVACDLERMREERIEFLESLGAHEPRPPAPEVAPGARERRARQPTPERRFEQGERHRYRLQLRKVGRAVYTGHLDLVRRLPRMLRRAGLEAIDRQGFHPHPQLSFGPALGLGIASLGEYVDVQLADDVDADELLDRLVSVSAPGLEVIGARRLGDDDPGVNKVIAVADYVAVLPDGCELDEGALERSVTVERKRSTRTLRLGDAVHAVSWVDPAQQADVLELPEGRCLQLRIAIAGGVKPAEAVEYLVGAEPRALARVGLWSEDGAAPIGDRGPEAIPA